MSVAYLIPEDVERVYEELIAHYREIETRQENNEEIIKKSKVKKESDKAVTKRSSLRMARNSLPLPLSPDTTNCVKEKESVVAMVTLPQISATTSDKVLENKRSSLLMARTSLPLLTVDPSTLAAVNSVATLSRSPSSSSILKVATDRLSIPVSSIATLVPKSAKPTTPTPIPVTPTTPQATNYANSARGPKKEGALPKVRRTVSGSFASLVGVFDKK